MIASTPFQVTPRGEFRLGMRIVGPALLATAAWGLVTGVAMVKTGLSPLQAAGMTLFVYAGSAQLAALPLIIAGVPVWLVLLTATIVNLRFVIYAATLAPRFAHMSRRWKLLLGYHTTDVGLVMFLQRVDSEPERPHRHWLFMGMATGNWLAWQISSMVGIALASQVPATWGLDFAGTLALLALTVPLIASRAATAGVLATGAMALVGAAWPYRLGLLAAVAVGMAVALTVEHLTTTDAS